LNSSRGLSGCKLLEIADADRLFQAPDALNYRFEAVVAKSAAFLLPEFLRIQDGIGIEIGHLLGDREPQPVAIEKFLPRR
jgi:hypothetical protein